MRAVAPDQAVVLPGFGGEITGEAPAKSVQGVQCIAPLIEEAPLQRATPGVIANTVDQFTALAAPRRRQPLRVFGIEGAHALGGQRIQRGNGVFGQLAVATEYG
ncbi:hypothetical protein D3C84_1039530 [compost metagenome]